MRDSQETGNGDGGPLRGTGPGWLGLVAIAAIVFWAIVASTLVSYDVPQFLAAGERLNAGHDLYALIPGDRPVTINETFPAPLLYPPLIAVLWRPLALLGDASVVLWLIVSAGAMLAATAYALRQPGGALIVLLASIGIGVQLNSGNPNGLIIAGFVAIWVFRDRPWIGVVAGAVAMIKLWPALMIVWLAATRRWGAVAVALATCAALLVVSFIGAGIDSHIESIQVLNQLGPHGGSLSSIAHLWWLSPLVGLLGMLLVVATGRRDALSYRLSILTMFVAAPGIGAASLALLVPLAAPGVRSRLAGDPRPEAGDRVTSSTTGAGLVGLDGR